MTEPVSRQSLEELHSKYMEILALRVAPTTQGDTRRRMAALSTRFPGSLRELDDMELGEVARRTSALEGVLHRQAAVEAWMGAIATFHALARGALCAKRWLRGRKQVDTAVERAFAEALPTLPFATDAELWRADLQSLASPPRGHVTDAVLARVAARLGTNEREARLLVFGVPRRERRRQSEGLPQT